MILKHTIVDLIKQEATLKFSDITTFSKMKYISDEPLDEEHFQLEIVYQNSRRTRLVCSESEYKKFKEGYDRYVEWLEQNPSLEQSRIDMSMLDRIIKENVRHITESALEVNNQIQEGLVAINEKMTNKILEHDKLLSTKAESKMKEIDDQLSKIKVAMGSIERVADLMNNFVPETAQSRMEDDKDEKESIIDEVSTM